MSGNESLLLVTLLWLSAQQAEAGLAQSQEWKPDPAQFSDISGLVILLQVLTTKTTRTHTHAETHKCKNKADCRGEGHRSVLADRIIICSVYTLTQTGDREFRKFKPSTRGESGAGGAAAIALVYLLHLHSSIFPSTQPKKALENSRIPIPKPLLLSTRLFP